MTTILLTNTDEMLILRQRSARYTCEQHARGICGARGVLCLQLFPPLCLGSFLFFFFFAHTWCVSDALPSAAIDIFAPKHRVMPDSLECPGLPET